MAAKKYPWEVWCKRRKGFTIDPSNHETNLSNLSQAIRNRACREQLGVSLEVTDDGKLKVKFYERS